MLHAVAYCATTVLCRAMSRAVRTWAPAVIPKNGQKKEPPPTQGEHKPKGFSAKNIDLGNNYCLTVSLQKNRLPPHEAKQLGQDDVGVFF